MGDGEREIEEEGERKGEGGSEGGRIHAHVIEREKKTKDGEGTGRGAISHVPSTRNGEALTRRLL